MELSLFIKGLILGFSIAAPVGPIGILCIRRSLDESRLSGFISGLGAASADALYASIANIGLSVISSFLVSQQLFFRLFGGIFILVLGINSFLKTPVVASHSQINKKNLVSNFISTFLLTLSNPITIISFTAIFSGIGLLNTSARITSPFFLIFGVFIGSTLWWILLSASVGSLRLKINISNMKWINRISGLILVGFGVMSLISLILLKQS
jgi:threonine/homoserine/homoserine lactone efflux protein